MPTILIDKNELLRGLHSDDIGLANSQEAPRGKYIRTTGADLFRVGYKGHISSPQIFGVGSISNAAINSHPRAVAIDITASTPNVYYLLGGLAGTAPRIVEIINDAYDSTVRTIAADAGDNFTTLPATGFWGEDIILYKVGTTVYVFYSWNDNDDGDVGRFDLGGANPDDDWLSTTAASGAKLVSAVPHRMVEGSDGNLYVTNGRYVAQFDGSNGANGTFDNDRYDLGVGWIAIDIRKYGNFLAVAGVKSGAAYINYTFSSECRVTLWNMVEPGLGLEYGIDDNFISAIFAVKSRLYAWTRGKGNTVKLWKFDGQGFNLLWENAVYTTTPDPRGIEIYKGLVCWVESGNVLAFDLATEGVHHPFIINDGTNAVTPPAQPGGLLKNTDQSKLFVGGLFASTYQTAQLTFASTNFPVASTYLRTRVFPLTYRANIKKFKFYLSQLAANAQVQFSLFSNYTNQSVGTAGTDLLNLTLDNTTYGAITEFEYAWVIPDISAFYITITITGQVSVRAIEVEWQPLR